MSESREAKRIELLGAAERVLARYGFKKTNLDDIAAEAGVATTSLYYYFKNKKDLFSSVIRHESEVLLDEMRRAVDGAATPEEKLVAMISARYRRLGELKALHSVTREIADEVNPLVQTERARFFDAELALVVGILEEGVAAGEFVLEDPGLFARVFLAGMQGLDHSFFRDGGFEQVADKMGHLSTVIIYGLKKRS